MTEKLLKKTNHKKSGTLIPGTLSVLLNKRCTAIISYENTDIFNTSVKLSESLLNSFAENVLIVDLNLLCPIDNNHILSKPAGYLQDLISDNQKTIKEIKVTISTKIDMIFCRRETTIEIGNFFSKNLEPLLDQIKSNYHYALFLLPPLTMFSGIPAITSFFDSVIINLVSGKTRWESARFLKDSIERCGGNICGTILSERKFYVPEFIYNHL